LMSPRLNGKPSKEGRARRPADPLARNEIGIIGDKVVFLIVLPIIPGKQRVRLKWFKCLFFK